MLLKFTGFPEQSWKRDEPASVDGFGEIKKGRVKNYPDDPENDIAEFLLATKNFAVATDEDEKASREAEQEEADALVPSEVMPLDEVETVADSRSVDESSNPAHDSGDESDSPLVLQS